MFEQYLDQQQIEPFPGKAMFRISYDNTVNKLKIISNSDYDLNRLKIAFSAQNPVSFYVSQYGYAVESVIYMINKFGFFQAGLFFDILNYIKLTYGNLEYLAISKNCLAYINDYITPLKQYFNTKESENFKLLNISEDSGRNKELIKENKPEYLYRDYQINAIMALIKKCYGRGVIEIPTSGGKSFIISNFIYNIHAQINNNYTYLILVPNKQLVSQFFGDLIDYGLDKKLTITKFTGEKTKKSAFDASANVIISNRQFIFKNFSKLPKIDVLIADEIHQTLAPASASFIENLNCKIKVGCTGTPPKDKLGKLKLTEMFSKIAYTETITKLQTQGFITKLKISLIKVNDSYVENNKNLLFNLNSNVRFSSNSDNFAIKFDDAYKAEIEYINENYKSLYLPILDKLSNLEGNSLFLFDRIEFGTNMYKLATEQFNNKENYYIDGGIDVKIREEVRAKLESVTNANIFAQTATFSTGINIKNLTNIIFFFSGKSFYRIIQSIGRTLRLHEDKEFARVYDVSFNFKYSKKHLYERLEIYKEAYNIRPTEVITLNV